jgi:hypothetical protein
MSDTQKTYDPQTAKLLAVLAENMPKLSSAQMQEWIDTKNRKVLQRALSILHHGPEELTPLPRVFIGDPDSRATYRKDPEASLHLPIEDITLAKGNPFSEYGIYSADLFLGVEYDSPETPCKPVIRPWLLLIARGDEPQDESGFVDLRSMDYWQGLGGGFFINIDKRKKMFLTRSEQIAARDEYMAPRIV